MISINILNKVYQLINNALEIQSLKLKEVKIKLEQTEYEKYIVEDSKGITAIVNTNPVSYQDAEILLKGFLPILTQCRPTAERLEEYVKSKVNVINFQSGKSDELTCGESYFLYMLLSDLKSKNYFPSTKYVDSIINKLNVTLAQKSKSDIEFKKNYECHWVGSTD